MIYVTEKNSGGRFGHRVMNIITPLIVSRLFGATYIHTTTSVVDKYFSFEKTPPPALDDNRVHGIDAECWEGLSYEQAVDVFAPRFRACAGEADHLFVIDDRCRIHLPHAYEWFTKGLIPTNVYEDVVAIFRKAYRKAGTGPAAGRSPESPDGLRIAIHIRRGDLSQFKSEDPSHIRYYYPIVFYRAVVRSLQAAFAGRNCRVHIYSEAKDSEDIVGEFGGRESEGIILHIGQPFAADFHGMIGADVFVMASSAMSMTIAYLSEGVKFYLPNYVCRMLPPEQFIAVDPAGAIADDSLHALIRKIDSGRDTTAC